MFESHFGFTAPPFQLSPDPSFYYDSRGHSQALSYLKYGVYQREGFVVFTGDVGSGKTTLVRALLEKLDPTEVVAAHVVNTQLDCYQMLQSICAAFRIPTAGETKAQLLSTLEAYFTALAANGRRALMIIDEAQNLGLAEAEELRMLSNFQIGNQALVQSFLVGQPELRLLLGAGPMEPLRQRVIASCHLSGLTAIETRAYVEHRLRRVGWQGFPAVSDRAFAKIHTMSGGIPRRINLLCTRILMASWLAGKEVVSSSDVTKCATELGAELQAIPQAQRQGVS